MRPSTSSSRYVHRDFCNDWVKVKQSYEVDNKSLKKLGCQAFTDDAQKDSNIIVVGESGSGRMAGRKA